MANTNEKKGMLIDVQPLKSKQEVNELIEALGMSTNGLRDQLLFKLGISTGLRCGDLVALKVEQVKGRSSFKIREGKTKKERTVYLNSLMADIADYIDTLPVGMGLGGELPVASTLVSESVAAKERGRVVVLLESF
ncbi:tyrosine-type recombinase/integrase, partial [Lysinibacillus capsici]|uniref:tyrosine-type recombinase/integrase n=1 Tax=Lysinibacillus capsici TaxID=2115968 RepID=UPI0026466639